MPRLGVDIDVGSDHVELTDGFRDITGFYLTGLRGKLFPLTRAEPDFIEELRQEVPCYYGLPQYYAVKGDRIVFWPAAAYFWTAIIEVPKSSAWEPDPNAAIPVADRIAGADVKTCHRRPD